MIDWNDIARRLGYADDVAMWQALYVEQKLSIVEIGTRLGISRNTVRQALEHRGIARRTRGGANHNALDLTDKVIDEVRRNGVTATAKRLEISYTTLYKRLRAKGLSTADLRKGDTDANADVRVKE